MTQRRTLFGLTVLVAAAAGSVFLLAPTEYVSACATCGCAPASVNEAKDTAKGLFDQAKTCKAGCTCAKCAAKAKATDAAGKKCGSGCTKPCCANKASAKKCGPGCEKACCAKKDGDRKCDGKTCARKVCRKALRAKLKESLAAIDEATKAVASGDKTTALAKLAEARKPLDAMNAKLDATCKCKKNEATARPASEAKPAAKPEEKPAPKPTVVFFNSKCPIMGNKIDPAKVTAALTRDYAGKKVAFCSPSCTKAWDKLPGLAKRAALARSK